MKDLVATKGMMLVTPVICWLMNPNVAIKQRSS